MIKVKNSKYNIKFEEKAFNNIIYVNRFVFKKDKFVFYQNFDDSKGILELN
jgi:hypothetical protein